MGLDSLGAVEFANVLGDAVGRAVDATLTFNHPTLSAVTDYLCREIFGRADELAETRSRTSSIREPIALIGFGCRLPPGVETQEAALVAPFGRHGRNERDDTLGYGRDLRSG